MLRNRHFLYTCFMCHQVIEKIFKACYAKLKDQIPPRTHDLPRLAKEADFYDIFSDKQKLFLNTMNPFNIEARYPNYKTCIAKTLTDERCKQIFEETQNLQQWIKETILLEK